jgi:hypothetical protein
VNHSAAGLKGVECRRARAELKRELKAGTRRLCEVLYEPTLPDCLRSMPLHELLEAVPRLTPSVYEPMLEEVPIKLTALCSEPTYRKRRELIKRLEAWEQRKEQPGKSGRRILSHKARWSGGTAQLMIGKESGREG